MRPATATGPTRIAHTRVHPLLSLNLNASHSSMVIPHSRIVCLLIELSIPLWMGGLVIC